MSNNDAAPNDATPAATTTTPSGSTTVGCRCGQVAIEFANAGPKLKVECCCCDCRSTIDWCHRPGKQVVETGKPHCNKPASLYYVDNDILSVKGEEELYLFKLRTNSPTRRVVAKCCHTPLVGQHPLYFQNRVVILGDVAKVTMSDPNQSLPLVHCRIQTKYWATTCFGDDNPLPELPEGVPSFNCDGALWFVQSGMLPFMITPAPSREGFPIETLLDKLQLRQQPPHYANIDEQDLEGYFRTGGGMFSLTMKNPFYNNNKRQKEETQQRMNE